MKRPHEALPREAEHLCITHNARRTLSLMGSEVLPAHHGDDLPELAVRHDEVAQRGVGVDEQAVGGLAHIVGVQALLSVALDGLLAHSRWRQLRAACKNTGAAAGPISVL